MRAEGCRLAQSMAEVVSPRRADTHPLANGGSLTEEESSAFECNICYEIAQSPVVTLCGHLYCWPCLYRCARGAAVLSLCESCACWQSCARALFPCLSAASARRWMQVQSHCRVCPVCKAGIEQDKARIPSGALKSLRL